MQNLPPSFWIRREAIYGLNIVNFEISLGEGPIPDQADNPIVSTFYFSALNFSW